MQTKMVNAYFHTDLEILPIQADSRWFLKVLSSLLCVPKLYTGDICQVEYTLTKEGQYLRITVTGSPLYHIWKDEQEQRILHLKEAIWFRKENKKWLQSPIRWLKYHFLRIIVSPSRKGRITFSTLESCAIRSLKALMPMVCKSVRCGCSSSTCPSHKVLSARI